MGESQYTGAIDFGRGYIATKFRSFLLYEKPDRSSRRIARIDPHTIEGVQSDSLVFLPSQASVPLSNRTIDVVYNEVYGLPILTFSPDSSWAQISLDCREMHNPPSAWVNANDARNKGVDLQLWSSFFNLDQAVIFHGSSAIEFYNQPNESSRAFPDLAGDPKEPDYCMRVIRTIGPWMQVYLESPSTFMKDSGDRQTRYKSSSAPPKFWIKYLDEEGRPRIWYLWD